MNLQDWLSALTWRDGLDFGLLFFISYGLLRVVQGTRALPVMVAVAVLGVIAWLVRALDLIAVASLLKYFFESIIILLIVVFQQELRRLMVYLGQRVLPSGRRRAAQSAVGELVSGLERLQRARVGALVILQGEIDVLEVATGKGIEVDAPLRAETIVALQIPHAANTAHDGALVIQEFRIMRAGVICPLSQSELDPRFGTRHRGAIGCSEETDCLALVLSEERGDLRIAERGSISEPLELSKLEARIAQWLETPRAEGTRSPGEADSRADMSRADLKIAEEADPEEAASADASQDGEPSSPDTMPKVKEA